MQSVKLNAEVRTEFSKGAVNKLRKSGRVPGVLYHHGEPNVHFSVEATALLPLIYSSETHILELELNNGEKKSAVVKEFQFDPVTDNCIHFDLQGMNANEKITVDIPVVIVGTPIGVTTGGGLLQQSLHALHIKCLPTNLPEHIKVEVAQLELGQSIHVGDITLDHVEILNDAKSSIVAVIHKKVQEEASATATTAAATPTEPELVGGKGKKEEAK